MYNESKILIDKIHSLQKRLSQKLVFRELPLDKIHYVAGVDVAYTDDQSIGAVAVLDFPNLNVVEVKTEVTKTSFPYIPTLLSFREIPALMPALKKLKSKPDVYLVDGHGYAHPFRFGLACHLGLILKAPTIGVAKSLLCGSLSSHTDRNLKLIVDKEEVIGAALHTGKSRKPIFISVGNLITLHSSIEIVKECILDGRIPEPIRCAHVKASEIKNRRRH